MKSQKPKKEGKLILPPPTANGRRELTPFLKPKDISKKRPTPLTLLGEGRESNGRFGKGIDVACKVGRKNYTLTVKYKSGNYSRLFDRFGSDIEKWKGIVKVKPMEYLGHVYVAVVD